MRDSKTPQMGSATKTLGIIGAVVAVFYAIIIALSPKPITFPSPVPEFAPDATLFDMGCPMIPGHEFWVFQATSWGLLWRSRISCGVLYPSPE